MVAVRALPLYEAEAKTRLREAGRLKGKANLPGAEKGQARVALCETPRARARGPASQRRERKPFGRVCVVADRGMSLGAVGGGAVRLAPASEHLAVGEGIESSLSVMQVTGVPTWAALSAGGIKLLILPPLPLASVITITADNDPTGLAAAHDAAERWTREGRRVRIALPPEGRDFNDLLRGAAA